MGNGEISVYCGGGIGKTMMAIGKAVRSANSGKTVIMIQFLKGRSPEGVEVLARLEPEIRLFRFEKFEKHYEELSEEEKKEEARNIQNGVNFARKVMLTGECDVLILDEILRLMDEGLYTVEELLKLVQSKADDMELVLTGRVLPDELKPYVNFISKIEA
jgi:cob(I)alamin adenosyltransferase